MQEQQSTQQKQRFFTASEVAEFEYCPLVWWHERFEPLAQADTEELFARLVELEHDHGTQAPALPEYQTIEQLLLREGVFDQGQQQHREHAEEVEEIEQEVQRGVRATGRMRIIALVAAVMLLLALILIVAALLVR